MRQPSSLKMIGVLIFVCAISAAALGYVYTSTEDAIAGNRKKRMEEAVYNVLPGITGYECIKQDPAVYRGISEDATAGYAIMAQGMGFQGDIVLMVGLGPDMDRITGVSVLESVETPGLGDRIKSNGFLGQFRNMDIPNDRSVRIDTITGATISSNAVRRIVSKAVKDAEGIH